MPWYGRGRSAESKPVRGTLARRWDELRTRGSLATLNLIYNLADFVNKIAFCLAIWACAKADTAEKAKAMQGLM